MRKAWIEFGFLVVTSSLFLGRGKEPGAYHVDQVLGRGGSGRLALLGDGEDLLLASGGRLAQYTLPEGKEILRYSGELGDPVFL